MDFRAVSGLLCGIGIFLFSVVQMSESMKKLCEKKAESVLQRFTKNRLSGVLCSAALTAVVQSSAAVTVTAVSLADCGKLSLSACTGIIMGSNIGTTATGVLVALNFYSAAPFLVLFGAFFLLVSKNEKIRAVSLFLCSLGFLFVGIETMKDSCAVLNENGLLSSFFSRCSSRFSALLFGFVSTALVQSSSATVGILQSLVSVGAVSRESAVFIICGQNIGATVPTLLSALSSDKKAKAAALFHLLFNLFGTASVVIVSFLFPVSALFEKIEKGEVFVSAVHVLFNVLCTAVMFPFSTGVTDISEKIVGLFERKSNRHLFGFLSESAR